MGTQNWWQHEKGVQTLMHDALFKGRRVWASARPSPRPIREPTFQIDNGAAGWVATTYPNDQRDRKTFLVLFFLGGFIDAGHDTVSVRELAASTTLEPKRVLQILVKLERERWLVIEWAQDRFESNRYSLNYDGRPVEAQDPYRNTYQPKRKETK